MARIRRVISAVRYLAAKIGYYERETLVESSSTFASQSRRVHNGLLLIYLRAPSLHFSSSFRPSSCYLRPCRGRWVVHEDSGGKRSGGRKKSTAVPRRNSAYPAHRTDSRSSERKSTPVLLFFFYQDLAKSFCKREREREGVEPLWNISWSQSSIQRKERFFLWLKFNLFRWQMLLYPNIFSYFAIKVVA